LLLEPGTLIPLIPADGLELLEPHAVRPPYADVQVWQVGRSLQRCKVREAFPMRGAVAIAAFAKSGTADVPDIFMCTATWPDQRSHEEISTTAVIAIETAPKNPRMEAARAFMVCRARSAS
jgi:hypothetical protein